MKTKFELICDELGFDSEPNNQSQFDILREWCETNISQDLSFRGNDNVEFYRGLVGDYFDHLLVNALSNPEANQSAFNGMNAIQYAARRGYDRYISGLTDLSGQAFNIVNNQKLPPLFLAAFFGHSHTVFALLGKGADVHLLSRSDQLPTYTAVTVSMSDSDNLIVRNNKETIFRYCFDSKTMKHQDSSGNTIAHKLAEHGFEQLLKEVLEEERSILLAGTLSPEQSILFVFNNQGHFPIHTAILNQQLEIAKVMLDVAGVASLEDNDGRIPLHYAAQYGSIEMLKLCFQADPTKVDEPDQFGRTAYMLAQKYRTNNHNILNALVSLGANPGASLSSRPL